MEPGIHTSSKNKLRKSNNKTEKEINISVSSAVYLNNYKILLFFNNGQQRIVNFLPLFSKLTGAYSKFCQPEYFKKFIVKKGNIYWGKNEDVIFPVHTLYSEKFSTIPKEEILYVL